MIENHVFWKNWSSRRYFNHRRGAIFGFFWWISKTNNGVAVSQTNMNCQAGSIALAKHVYIVFLGAFKRHNFFDRFYGEIIWFHGWFISFCETGVAKQSKKNHRLVSWFHSFIDSYHSVNPMWQNKLTKKHKMFFLLHSFIDSYYSVKPVWRNISKKTQTL